MPSKKEQAKPGQNVEFLFLASHGLLSPISAIRWGTSRLQKSDMKGFSKEQKELVDHVHANASILSKLFASMLLLARNEDRTYSVKSETVALTPLLTARIKEWEEHDNGKAKLTAGEALSIQSDKTLLDAVVQNLLSVFSEAGSGKKNVAVTIQTTADGEAEILFSGKLELPFLQSVRTLDQLSQTRPIVGGTAGLLLSLSAALLQFLEGTLEMREQGKDTYNISLKLPAA